MSLAWLVQRLTGQGGWADAFWSLGTGAAGVGLALLPIGEEGPSARQALVAVLIGLWGLRLGLHIARRAASETEDPRYVALRQTWGDQHQIKLFGFLMLQAGAASLLLLSVVIAARRPGEGLTLQDAVAAAVFLCAVIGEALADRQLAAFKADPGNRGRVCNRGLWAWSRHPNYFFEWLGWCAWPVFAIDVAGDWPWGWLALTAPAYIYWLLTKVSGLPMLEAHMRRSRNAAWEAYAVRTSPFFPRPPRGLDPHEPQREGAGDGRRAGADDDAPGDVDD